MRGLARWVAGWAWMGSAALSLAAACPLTAGEGRLASGASVQAAWQVAGPGGTTAIEP